MRYVTLTGTDLTVSQLALGTAQFGSGCPKEQAFHVMDAYVDLGGSLIDTAHAYGMWIPGAESPSEETIGAWLNESGKRDKVFLSTKGGHPFITDMTAMRVRPEELEKDLTASLKKLGVDCVDLYFLHRDDPSVPVADLLGWLEERVKEGKIRYYGCSNWSLARMKEAQETAQREGFRGFACSQVMGCLADVHPETLPPSNVVMDADIRSYHKQTQLSFMAYMAIARGYFLQRLSGAPINDESKANYTCPSNDRIVEELRALVGTEVDGVCYSALDFCYQYLVQQEFPTIPVAGFSSGKHLEEAVRAIDCAMPAQLLQRVAALKELQK